MKEDEKDKTWLNFILKETHVDLYELGFSQTHETLDEFYIEGRPRLL